MKTEDAVTLTYKNWNRVDCSQFKHMHYGLQFSPWCNLTFAKEDWLHNGENFYFRQEKDAIMFRLKWIK